MGQNEIEKYCHLGKEEERMMRQAYEVMNLTVRSYHKVLKVARTIADWRKRRRSILRHFERHWGIGLWIKNTGDKRNE